MAVLTSGSGSSLSCFLPQNKELAFLLEQVDFKSLSGSICFMVAWFCFYWKEVKYSSVYRQIHWKKLPVIPKFKFFSRYWKFDRLYAAWLSFLSVLHNFVLSYTICRTTVTFNPSEDMFCLCRRQDWSFPLAQPLILSVFSQIHWML